MPSNISKMRGISKYFGNFGAWLALLAKLGACVLLLAPSHTRADTPQTLNVVIGVLGRQKAPPPLYDLSATPPDEGLQGARLAQRDNNTTGAFLGQHFDLDEVLLAPGQSAVAAAQKLADAGVGLIVADLAAAELLAVADALRDRGVLVLNVAAPDDSLRGKDCRANLFHTAPSRAMLTDALAQFLAVKQWSKLFVILGPHVGDRLYAEALRGSAKKFGLKIAAEKPWTYGALARARGDSVTMADALLFTQGVTYDIMVVADEAGDFGDYISYRTWDPKLVAGTQGLIAASWHPTQYAWGSEQLQERFLRQAGRLMRPVDYQAWVAVRALGEAVVQTRTADPRAISAFMLGPDFDLAAFKGVGVSFRPWDRQMRQPLLLAQPASLVAVAPLPGFLHQRTPLDTLGVDEPETECRLK
jgi:ABC transporter substrate binding protein (PQQ-dependent alcohol dehydrogenase system)